MGKRRLKDANLLLTFALPAAASTSTNSTALDTGVDNFKLEEVDLVLSVPALNATIVPDTRTVTLIIESSAASNFGTVVKTVISQTFTGAGGVGIPASEVRARIPTNGEQYYRGKITFGASTTDGSAVTAEFSAQF